MLRALQIGKPGDPWTKRLISHAPAPIGQCAFAWVFLTLGLILIFKRTQGYRLLILPSYSSQALFTLYGKALGCKIIWLTDSRKISPWLGKILKANSAFTSAIIAPNQSQEVSYLRLGIPGNKTRVFYPPFSLQDSNLTLKDQTIFLACDASVEIDDGLGTLLRAASLARDILGNVKIIIGGSFTNKNHLEWSARQLNLESSLLFSPGENAIWLEDIHIYVLPTISEKSVPISLAQALAKGKVIIATDKPPHREFVGSDNNGLLTPEGDAEALSQAIIRLAREPELLTRLGQGSYKFAQERFAKEAFQEKLKSILSS